MKKFALLIAVAAFTLSARAQNDFQRTAKGTLYKVLTHNPGDKIKVNDIVTFNAIQKTDKDSILFSSYMRGAPMQAQVQGEGDLMDVFPLLTAKDSVLIKIPTDSLFKGREEQRPPFLPKGSNMYFVLKIERVQSLEEAMAERTALVAKYSAEEKTNLDKYIADNKLVLLTTPSGVKYKITKPSALRKPKTGDTVYVNYTGRLLNGKVFDSSVASVAKAAGLEQPGRTYEPISFPLGTEQIIQGWNIGVALLGIGGKATLYIPSTLGYGERGSGDNTIPPFSTLVFDVELVKIKSAGAAISAKKPTAKSPAKKSTTTKKKS